MKLLNGARRAAHALAWSFAIFPQTDYQKSYPRKSTSERRGNGLRATSRCNDRLWKA